jgi:hypothetical protein
MKKTLWILSALLGSWLAFSGAGCNHQAASERPQTLEDGVAQLRKVLVNASPEVQSNLYSGVAYSIRYGNFIGAAGALDQIASNPSLNDQQKKKVNEVVDLLKQAIQNQQNAPKPGQ